MRGDWSVVNDRGSSRLAGGHIVSFAAIESCSDAISNVSSVDQSNGAAAAHGGISRFLCLIFDRPELKRRGSLIPAIR
jgi:hypothetical protein